MLANLLKNSDSSEIRAAACYAIGCLFNVSLNLSHLVDVDLDTDLASECDGFAGD